MRIAFLADEPATTSVLSCWLLVEWFGFAGRSWKEACVIVWERCNRDQLPMALVAMDGDNPIGMASLVERTEPYGPTSVACLTGLYVESAWRGRGIGTQLCDRVVAEARRLGFSLVSLYTTDREEFYSRLGWVKVCDTVVEAGDSYYFAAYMQRQVGTIPLAGTFRPSTI
jgi:predicted N-acetyltransferase YhbS